LRHKELDKKKVEIEVEERKIKLEETNFTLTNL